LIDIALHKIILRVASDYELFSVICFRIKKKREIRLMSSFFLKKSSLPG